ncbi:MAG: hypothetical protein FJ387_25960, partial [Verrucomicrobia bacterium]|nr:hypothetical protein [Verrucomicrobiota bacterium]
MRNPLFGFRRAGAGAVFLILGAAGLLVSAPLEAAASPEAKPQAFSTTGSLSAGEWHYFQVDIPAGSPGWRLVLNVTSGSAARLYLRQGDLPTTSAYARATPGSGNDTLVLTETEALPGTWYLGVQQPAGSGSYALYSEVGYLTALAWDPGLAADGTAVFTSTSPTGGDYFFTITAQNPNVGIWRTALHVLTGEAHVYLRPDGFASSPAAYPYGSARSGSDGLVLNTSQFTPGQVWYVLVRATPGAQWKLLSGDAFVHDLGPLAADGSSGASVTIRPDGIAYFRTTVPASTLAWRLWLQGGSSPIYVRRSAAPHPASQGSWDLRQNGAMLVVPPYLNAGTFNGSYFVGVPGDPGTRVDLDSRQHSVVDIPFDALHQVSATAADFPYVTYRTQVPVQQIAWQVSLTPSSGNPNLAIRRDLVPNEFRNDAFSDVPGTVGDSVTLVPATGTAGITDGTYYVTVYGATPFAASLTQGQPVVTDEPFRFTALNDASQRAGWRYYRVGITGGIQDQLGSLGWQLLLTGAPPGTEIALRRNALPGRWRFRDSDAGLAWGEAGHVDHSSTSGLLQRPGHQADIWYIGVYQPVAALGEFTLSGADLQGEPAAFDGASFTVASQPPGQWRYYRVDVPADSQVLGWDLRLSGVTAGYPQMVVRRDALPGSVYSTIYGFGTTWPSGSQWAG